MIVLCWLFPGIDEGIFETHMLCCFFCIILMWRHLRSEGFCIIVALTSDLMMLHTTLVVHKTYIRTSAERYRWLPTVLTCNESTDHGYEQWHHEGCHLISSLFNSGATVPGRKHSAVMDEGVVFCCVELRESGRENLVQAGQEKMRTQLISWCISKWNSYCTNVAGCIILCPFCYILWGSQGVTSRGGWEGCIRCSCVHAGCMFRL